MSTTLRRALANQVESEFQRAVVEYARLNGWLCYHTFDSRRSEAGYPDLTMVRDRLVFAELKSPNGRVRPGQETWLRALRKAGGETYLWRPEHWPEIERVLARGS